MVARQLEKHQESLVKNLQRKQKEEQLRQEELEVHQYEQSVRKATLVEDTDMVLVFLEEFLKKQTGNGKAARDELAFKDLAEADKEAVNEMLKGFGIQYKGDAF